MKKLFIIFIVIFLLLSYTEIKADEDDLPERYKKWLEEEVVYLIAPLEKEVFLQLQTDRERELFIEAFWKQRDPTPGTPENEFKKEHFRRINYVNHFFGRGAPIPGWRTDRGRVYIILGEPNDIQRYEGRAQTYPAEIWFYQGKTNLGLPSGFNLVFFQKGFTGDYRLYSPLQDGPQALMISYYGDPLDYLSAFKQLREIEPELAQVTLSLIPGDESAAMGHPSLSSDLLIQKVETSAIRQVEERYAQKFLEYKDIVEVEYTANYIDSDHMITIIKEPSGIYFVHYAIEPERLSMNEYENRYSTTLKLNGTATDSEGNRIFQFEKDISLNLNREQMMSLSHSPLSIRDMFPLISGNYRISILVKNEASKEFTSIERNLVIPQKETALQMTSIILGYKVSEKKLGDQRLKPFQLGNNQMFFQSNNVFLKNDDLIVAFQVHGLSPNIKENGELKLTFFKMGEEFRSFSRKFDQYPELPNIIEKFSLADFPVSHYRIQVSLLADRQEILSASEDFDITHSETLARPWIYAKLLPSPQDPIIPYLIGTQLFNSGKILEARERFEEAYRKKPESLECALNLARTYLRLAEYEKIEPVLIPFVERSESPSYEVLFIIGRAYQSLGKLDKAIETFDKAINHHGLNIHLLNAIGECYFQLGKPQEALVVWEKSLGISPDQPQIKKNVETLKQKK
jgi:GWxTD domain-containing protein